MKEMSSPQHFLLPGSLLDWLQDKRIELEWTFVHYTKTTAHWRIPPRSLADEILVYYPVRHRIAATFDTGEQSIGPGQLLMVDVGAWHRFENEAATSPCELFHMRFRLRRRNARKALRFSEQAGAYLLWDELEHLRADFELLYREYSDDAPYRELRLRSLLTALLVEVGRAPQHKQGDAVVTAETRTRSGMAPFSAGQRAQIDALASDRQYRMQPSELARSLRFNPDYFRQRFTRTYGMPPRQWLVKRRLEQAAGLLCESDLSVSEIADQVGYGDIFQFSRNFKKYYGVSPRAFRLHPRATRPPIAIT